MYILKFKIWKWMLDGRDLSTGLPKTITLYSSEIMEALEEPAMMIVDSVHSVLERTPPELAADISDKGIYMTGGGCLIDGLDKLLQEKTGINVMIAEDAISCVAIGTGKALDSLDGTRKQKLEVFASIMDQAAKEKK